MLFGGGQEWLERPNPRDGALLNACIEGREDDAFGIASSRWFRAWDEVDSNGMTVLHHAARRCWPRVVRAIVAAAPHLVQAVTAPNRKPSHWTALHCLADLPATKGQLDTARHSSFDVVQQIGLCECNVLSSRISLVQHFRGFLRFRGRVSTGEGFDDSFNDPSCKGKQHAAKNGVSPGVARGQGHGR